MVVLTLIGGLVLAVAAIITSVVTSFRGSRLLLALAGVAAISFTIALVVVWALSSANGYPGLTPTPAT